MLRSQQQVPFRYSRSTCPGPVRPAARPSASPTPDSPAPPSVSAAPSTASTSPPAPARCRSPPSPPQSSPSSPRHSSPKSTSAALKDRRKPPPPDPAQPASDPHTAAAPPTPPAAPSPRTPASSAESPPPPPAKTPAYAPSAPPRASVSAAPLTCISNAAAEYPRYRTISGNVRPALRNTGHPSRNAATGPASRVADITTTFSPGLLRCSRFRQRQRKIALQVPFMKLHPAPPRPHPAAPVPQQTFASESLPSQTSAESPPHSHPQPNLVPNRSPNFLSPISHGHPPCCQPSRNPPRLQHHHLPRHRPQQRLRHPSRLTRARLRLYHQARVPPQRRQHLRQNASTGSTGKLARKGSPIPAYPHGLSGHRQPVQQKQGESSDLDDSPCFLLR